MKDKWNRGIAFAKKEAVLSIALVLAFVSCFVVTPDKEYVEYIDFRTLGILFSLMAVMAGLQKIGVFGRIAGAMIRRVKGTRMLALILVMLCFFFSMVITNDVALITFVPLTFTVLRLTGERIAGKLMVPVVIMQTIAANLGSMLTPIGNPQNLYLYGKAGMDPGRFMVLMLPYTVVSLLLLLVWCLLQKNDKTDCLETAQKEGQESFGRSAKELTVYLVLFILCILTVARMVPYGITLAVVTVVVLIVDRKVLCKVDYGLLATFAGFFVFIGNMGRIPVFRDFLERMIAGNEVWTAVLSSQVISNVPAALLLSGFTSDTEALIVGTNLGGLGTLIASMASLISFKYVGKEDKGAKKRYLIGFTVANLIFLGILAIYHIYLG